MFPKFAKRTKEDFITWDFIGKTKRGFGMTIQYLGTTQIGKRAKISVKRSRTVSPKNASNQTRDGFIKGPDSLVLAKKTSISENGTIGTKTSLSGHIFVKKT